MRCEHCPVPTGGVCHGEFDPSACDYHARRRAEIPGLLAKAGNFVGSVVDHALDGGRKASPEVQAGRLRICRSNECGQVLDDGKGCNACGCGATAAVFNHVGLDMTLKRSWASSRCALEPPLWDAVQPGPSRGPVAARPRNDV